MELDPTGLDDKSIYRLFMGCIVPRPIAWVSTVDTKGLANLAPFSFFMGLAHRPPTLGVSIGGGPRRKDTLVNIESTKEFVVNVVTRELAEAMNKTSAPCAPGVDEFQIAGLMGAASKAVRAPRVKDSPIAMECRLSQIVPIASGDYHLCIGEVVHFHIDDAILKNGEIEIHKLRAISRLSADWYSELGGLFAMQRPAKA